MRDGGRWKSAAVGLVGLVSAALLLPVGPAGAATPRVVSIGSIHIWEPDAGVVAAEVPLTLSDPLPYDITVRWTFDPCATDCADVGVDVRRPKVWQVPIRAGSTRAFVTVAVVGDTEAEPSVEHLPIRLTGVIDPGNSTIISPDYPVGEVQIYDDDAALFPSQFIAMGSTYVVEGDTLTYQSNAGNPVTLGQPVNYDVFIGYAVDGGDATPWEDYAIPASQIAKIPAGHQVTYAKLPVYGDVNGEPDEFADVFLSSVSPAIFVPPVGANTPFYILQDDPPS